MHFSILLLEPRLLEEVGLLPKEVGGFDGIAICEKLPAEVSVEIAAAKCQEVTTLCHKILPLATFARLLGFIGEPYFFK